MTVDISCVREQAAAALAPFFLDVARGNRQTAIGAARSIIDGYHPAAPIEYQLAAQIIASQFAAMACLRTAAAAKGLPMGDVLTLRKAALSMDRAAQLNTDALKKHQAERQMAQPPIAQAPLTPAAFSEAMGLALENMRYADSRMPPLLAQAAAAPVRGKLKPGVFTGEPMTQALLARLAGEAAAGRRRPPGFDL